jgi:hypothetical protein
MGAALTNQQHRMTIRAIPTRYKGYHFRSRLEARWAVVLDALGICWRYEDQGYDLGHLGQYLPDFWLPDLNTFLEVKGASPTPQETWKLAELCRKRNSFGAFGFPLEDEGYLRHYDPRGHWDTSGNMDPWTMNQCYSPWDKVSPDWRLEPRGIDPYFRCGVSSGLHPLRQLCPVCQEWEYIQVSSAFMRDVETAVVRMWGTACGHSWEVVFSPDHTKREPSFIGYNAEDNYTALECLRHADLVITKTSFDAAVAAARSARFEHGERGAT